MLTNAIFRLGRVKTGPAGAGIIFCVGFKQFFAATHTRKVAVSFFILMRAAERAFCAMFASNTVLFGRQVRTPFTFRFFNFRHGYSPINTE